MTKNDGRVDLRLPEAVKKLLAQEAATEMRSLNAHILFILKAYTDGALKK